MGVGASGTAGGASVFTGEPLLSLELLAESALLFVAAVRLEYPESLARSGGLAAALFRPKSDDWEERLTATLDWERGLERPAWPSSSDSPALS